MFTDYGRGLRATSPKELTERLREPFVQSMIRHHKKEMIAIGTLAIYNNELADNERLIVPESLRSNQMLQHLKRTSELRRRGLIHPGPVMVSTEDLDGDEEQEIGDSTRIHLIKIDPQTGNFVDSSAVEIMDISPIYEINSLNLSEPELNMIQRHHSEQIEFGIVLKRPLP